MSNDSTPDVDDDRSLMTLRIAAKLAGVPRAYLDECVASGRLAVRLHHTSKGAKFRVTRAELESAGIVKPFEAREPSGESLLRLFREQSERLAAVEEQRFQLAGQLGAALERNRMLEEHMSQLTAGSDTQNDVDATLSKPASAGAAESPPQDERTLTEDELGLPAQAPLAKGIIGAKPAPAWPSKRAASILSKLRGFMRRSGGQ
jgi:hypothetical protein